MVDQSVSKISWIVLYNLDNYKNRTQGMSLKFDDQKILNIKWHTKRPIVLKDKKNGLKLLI